jgi:hypothetical protein
MVFYFFIDYLFNLCYNFNMLEITKYIKNQDFHNFKLFYENNNIKKYKSTIKRNILKEVKKNPNEELNKIFLFLSTKENICKPFFSQYLNNLYKANDNLFINFIQSSNYKKLNRNLNHYISLDYHKVKKEHLEIISNEGFSLSNDSYKLLLDMEIKDLLFYIKNIKTIILHNLTNYPEK